MSNTPQIRFAGFTDAWEQRKLGGISNICNMVKTLAYQIFSTAKNADYKIDDSITVSSRWVQNIFTSPDIDYSNADALVDKDIKRRKGGEEEKIYFLTV